MGETDTVGHREAISGQYILHLNLEVANQSSLSAGWKESSQRGHRLCPISIAVQSVGVITEQLVCLFMRPICWKVHPVASLALFWMHKECLFGMNRAVFDYARQECLRIRSVALCSVL